MLDWLEDPIFLIKRISWYQLASKIIKDRQILPDSIIKINSLLLNIITLPIF